MRPRFIAKAWSRIREKIPPIKRRVEQREKAYAKSARIYVSPARVRDVVFRLYLSRFSAQRAEWNRRINALQKEMFSYALRRNPAEKKAFEEREAEVKSLFAKRSELMEAKGPYAKAYHAEVGRAAARFVLLQNGISNQSKKGKKLHTRISNIMAAHPTLLEIDAARPQLEKVLRKSTFDFLYDYQRFYNHLLPDSWLSEEPITD